MSRRRSAFTLIELLVVMAIIALLVALIIQTSGPIRKAVERAQCQTKLRGLGTAYLAYVSRYAGGHFPPIWSTTEYGVGDYASWYYPQNCYQIMVNSRFDSGWGPLVWHGLVTDADIFLCPAILAEDFQWWHDAPIPDDRFWTGAFANPEPVAAREMYFKGQTPPSYTRAAYNIRAYMYPRDRTHLVEQGVRAILADNFSVPTCVLERHETGVNAVYLDGSAQWVEHEDLWNNAMNWNYVVKEPMVMKLWEILDAAKD
jgi:prepilin-type N-terminal cleavage/methylation domain-containing protein/prepilin-type processing-associated H-X9-DG protein